MHPASPSQQHSTTSYGQVGPLAEQAYERARWFAYAEETGDWELARFVITLADNIGYACDKEPPVRLYRSQVCAMMGWAASGVSKAKVTRLWNKATRMGFLFKQLDHSDCPTDSSGNITNYKNTIVWVAVRRAPTGGEYDPGPPPRPARPRKQPPELGVRCLVCGGPVVPDGYKCVNFSCGATFTWEDWKRYLRGLRPRSHLRIVPTPPAAATEPGDTVVPAAIVPAATGDGRQSGLDALDAELAARFPPVTPRPLPPLKRNVTFQPPLHGNGNDMLPPKGGP